MEASALEEDPNGSGFDPQPCLATAHPVRFPVRPLRRGGRRALFENSGLAHAFENGRDCGVMRGVVAHRRPSGAGAQCRESRIERETGHHGGTRLVKATEVRERSDQPEI